METVEVVIKIPKNIYDDLFNKELQDWFIESEVNFYGLKIGKAIQNGTVLPKGHGNLIDRNKLMNRCLFMSNDDTAIEGMEYVTKSMIKYAKTVIEADKEVEDEGSGV